MKKLLIFMLVLGLTSVSQGDMAWFEVDASTPVPAIGVSETIQINLVADTPVDSWKMDLVRSRDPAGRMPGYPGDEPAVTGTDLVRPGFIINDTQNGYGMLFDYASGQKTSGAWAAFTTIASFEYIFPDGWSYVFYTGPGIYFSICPAPPGIAYLDGFGDPYVCDLSYVSYGGNIMPIVPEPATIVLLGLGGLLLRRRK